jgi:hypothetical protein
MLAGKAPAAFSFSEGYTMTMLFAKQQEGMNTRALRAQLPAKTTRD